MRIALIGCSKSKLDQRAPAFKLYTGQLFKAAWKRSQRPGLYDDTFILSAKHGLLGIFTETKPYNLALADLAPARRRDWGRMVVSQLKAALANRTGEAVTFEIFAGVLYVDALLDASDLLPAQWLLKAPVAGLGIGQQKAWLARCGAPVALVAPGTAAELVLQLDAAHPGDADAEFIVSAEDWARLVALARAERAA